MVCLPSGMYYLVNKVVLPGSFSQIFCLSCLLNTSAFDFLNWRPLNFGTFGNYGDYGNLCGYPIPRSADDSSGVPHTRQITAEQSPQVSGSFTSRAQLGQ